MGKKLVAYFSASGTTRKIAEMIAQAAEADLFEIMPKQPYSKADLNWMDKKSRSSVEMSDKKFRPEIIEPDFLINKYDEIILGFPIWWYVAPTIINTFLESYDLTGKKIVLFATSGGSGFGNTVSELKESAPNAVMVEGKVFNKTTKQEISEWVKRIS
ncbi:MAG: flavodoxin [Oliverpabstia sp.]